MIKNKKITKESSSLFKKNEQTISYRSTKIRNVGLDFSSGSISSKFFSIFNFTFQIANRFGPDHEFVLIKPGSPWKYLTTNKSNRVGVVRARSVLSPGSPGVGYIIATDNYQLGFVPLNWTISDVMMDCGFDESVRPQLTSIFPQLAY